MLNKLKHRFPNSLFNKKDAQDITEYFWFEDSFGDTLGIPRSEISADEIRLLRLLFDSPALQRPNTSTTYTTWNDFLFGSIASQPLTNWANVRFTYFNLAHADFSHDHFEEAILSFLPSDSILIWENETAGILIESDIDEFLPTQELLAISSTLESDFYVKIRIYAGRFHPVDVDLHQHLNQERKCFKLALMYLSDLKVSDLSDIIPFALMNDCTESDKTWYINELLGKTRQDPELIKTVKTYIESNSNASSAAKQLYIHRNSLQYRIDKFADKTGLDVRNFRHALAAYLLLIMISEKG
ncbi:PucR family transcriptional regulator [Peribacillus sp. NPDC097675]|uniref:PucR family transcriptional regulator n=1 Tax=Peribacillus sp. NPDC097675 TaxID=3390618 RepID=UPI003CFCF9C1